MLTCVSCGCVSPTGKAWFGYIAEESDAEEPLVALYCPPCAEREREARPRGRYL